MTASGPADCTADEPDEDVTGQCVGVLHGGMDDLAPVPLWDAVMKNYKVAQHCEQELATLDATLELNKKEQLKQKHAVAMEKAVEGISQLNHTDIHRKLKE